MQDYDALCKPAILLLLVLAVAAVPVMAAGAGKMVVPGISGAHCFGGDRYESGQSIQPTTDGGHILIGYTVSNNGDVSGNHDPSGSTTDVWVIKLDRAGTIQWQKTFGGSQFDYGRCIRRTNEGGYILLGQTRSNDGDVNGNHDPSGSSLDIWVVKLDPNGEIQWQRCLGGSLDEWGESIIQTNDLGYVLAGYSSSTDGDVKGNHGGVDVWVVKLDAWGNTQWQRCYGGTSFDSAYSIVQLADGDLLIGANTASTNGDVIGHHGAALNDIWIFKISSDGMIQWQKCLGGTGNEDPFSVQLTSDGGTIIAGRTYSTDGDATGNHGGFYDGWVVKLTPVGDIQWQRCLGGTGQDEVRSIQQTTDGGFILGGLTTSDDGDAYGIHRAGTPDAWVVKLKPDGSPQWQRCLGGSGDDQINSILQTPGGGFLFTGATWSDDGDITGFHGSADVWVVWLFAPPVLDGVAPARLTTGTSPAIALTGANLVQNVSGPNVTFYKPGTEIRLPADSFSADGKWVSCQPAADTFLSPGVYNVIVTTPDNQTFSLANAFTVSCGPAPRIWSITPYSSMQGSVLNPVTIKGSGFWAAGDIIAYLNRTGQPNINVRVTGVSGTQVTAEILVPAGAAIGKWNLVVQNPDGQCVVRKGAFTVTLRTFKPPRVSSVTPRAVTTGNKTFISGILGNFFNASASVTMTGPGGLVIPVSNVTVLSDTRITCDADLITVPRGYVTVIVTNPDGKKATRARALYIR